MTTAADAALPDNAIAVQGLRKIYKARDGQPSKEALKAVSLDIPRGSFFALLGPNGAGKSTLINILAGLVTKTEGTAQVWGYDIDRDTRMARRAIGIVPQELNLDPFFTPRELLEVQAGLYGVRRSERRTREILAAVGLADRADAYARTLSGGMRRRLLVAKAMVHSPPILVLDEPTAGVDIELRQQLWRYIRQLNAAGTTIVLTTHYLEEAEELCDRIAIINHGEVAACDEKHALLARLDSKALAVVVDNEVDDTILQSPPLATYAPEIRDRRVLLIRYRPSSTRVGDILNAVQAAGLGIIDLSTEETDLEDLFLQLTRTPERGPAGVAA